MTPPFDYSQFEMRLMHEIRELFARGPPSATPLGTPGRAQGRRSVRSRRDEAHPTLRKYRYVLPEWDERGD